MFIGGVGEILIADWRDKVRMYNSIPSPYPPLKRRFAMIFMTEKKLEQLISRRIEEAFSEFGIVRQRDMGYYEKFGCTAPSVLYIASTIDMLMKYLNVERKKTPERDELVPKKKA
jgi:hypothetical protein